MARKLEDYDESMRRELLSKIRIDDIIYKPSSRMRCMIIISNLLSYSIKGSLITEVLKETKLTYSTSLFEIFIKPKETKNFKFTLLSPREEGIYTLNLVLKVNERTILLGSIDFAVGDPTKREKLYISFVWHNHQAPNYYPNGTFHSLWAFIHTYADEFLPYYQNGAYLVHTYILLKHPLIKVTYHLSPSLLCQWKKAIEEGYKTTLNTIVKLPDHRIFKVKRALDEYTKLLKDGRIEVLTSFFAHPIAGFLLKKFSKIETVRDILLWELRKGFSITLDVLGVKSNGIWCPEMFWDMKLLPLLCEAGVEYVVLCEQHFKLSEGEKATIYEPYIVRNTENNESIVIFFRDRELSDWLGFKNNMPTLENVYDNLRRFILALFKRYLDNPEKVVVIALDGENWMIMSKFPQHTAVFLDKLYEVLERKSEYFETVTLKEALEKVPPKRELKYIPWGSWINLTASQWTGGVKDELWKEVERALKIIANLKTLGKRDKELLDRIYEAIAIAMDSDYFWYGDKTENQKIIKTWINHAISLVKGKMEKIEDITLLLKNRKN